MISLDIETTGLSPADSTITIIGLLDPYGLNILSDSAENFRISAESAEKRILQRFAMYLDSTPPDEPFLTYNGYSFDIPFIEVRARHHKMGEAFLHLRERPHVDLFPFVKHQFGRRATKEEACSKLANLYVPRKNDGLWIARLYSTPSLLTENDHIDTLAHNATDVCTTQRLYNVLKEFPDFQKWQFEQSIAESEVIAKKE